MTDTTATSDSSPSAVQRDVMRQYEVNVMWHPHYDCPARWEKFTKVEYLDEYGLTEHEWQSMVEAGAIRPAA